MPITYQPANLAGLPGIKTQPKIVAPTVETLRTVAPSFAKVASWNLPTAGSYLSLNRPGYTGSEFASMEQLGYSEFARTPKGMGVYASMPVIDPTKLPSYDTEKKQVKFGSTDWSMIDPKMSLENVTGEFWGLKTPMLGAGGTVADPFTWLNERDIALGNYPTRLLDYAWSTPVTLAMAAMGMQLAPGGPRTASGEQVFPFESNNAYWYSLTNWKGTGRPPTDDELLAEAKQEASKVTMTPSLLIPALFERFKQGRDVMVNSTTSGNERIDYLAKKELEAVVGVIKAGATGTIGLAKVGPLDFRLANTLEGAVAQFLGAGGQTARSLTTLIPGIGTPLASALMPVSGDTEELWSRLSPETRRSLLSDAGFTTMATDLWATLPLLSGAGALASALAAGAKGGEFMAWARVAGMVKGGAEATSITAGWSVGRAVLNVAREAVFDVGGMVPRGTAAAIGGFSTTLNAMNKAMAVGWTMMGANWALSAMVPGYAESIGYTIDQSRPFSDSLAAGFLDNIGYFSSGTGGLWTATRGTIALPRTVGKVVGKAGLLGTEELRTFASHFGGAIKVGDATRLYTRADGSAINATTFATPVKATIWSTLGNFVRDLEVARVERDIIRNPANAALDSEVRAQMANDGLRDGLQNLHERVTRLADLLQTARSTRSALGEFLLTDAQRVDQTIVGKLARELDDSMASDLAKTYSEARWQRLFRRAGIAIDPKAPAQAYRQWLVKEAARKGWRFDEREATRLYGNDVNEWRQLANLTHAQEFDAINAEVIEAAKISPADEILAHPEDYFLMRADHLFTDDADLLRSAVAGLKTDAPVMVEEETRALAARLIVGTKELDEWWARQKGKAADPREVDLDALNDFIEQAYSTLPGRHPTNVIDPLTMDYPINALARRLGKEGVFSIAYKPKDSIIAYKPVAIEQAIRVSKNAPERYSLEPPAMVAAQMPPGAATGMFHVTADRPAVMAEGLRARTELIEREGEGLMYHGTGNAASPVWYVFDPAAASETALVGKGLYTTASPRLARSYAGGGTAAVKEFRIPANARIFDTEAQLDDAFFATLGADIAKGRAGRMWQAADKARANSGDVLDPDAMLAPGGEWFEAIQAMSANPRGTYYDDVVDNAVNLTWGSEFKNGVNAVLADAGYDGLTHTGGRRVGGMGAHKVIVLFDPEAMMQRVKVTGTGVGGSYADHGNLVSMVTNPEAAKVTEDRLRLAVWASRGETTPEDILRHFEGAYVQRGMGQDWSDIAGWLVNNVDDVGSRFGYRIPATRDEFVAGLGDVYKSTPAYPEKMGELVLDLDRSLDKPGAVLAYPTDRLGAYDPTRWGMYSIGLATSPKRLALIDPAKIGTVQVAMRREVPQAADMIPRLAFADLMPLAQRSFADIAKEARADEWGYRLVGNDAELQSLIASGIDAPNSLMWQSASDLAKTGSWPDFLLKNGIVRVRKENVPSIERAIPSQLVEVLGADGAWKRLGAIDRLPNEPVPRETMDGWIGRMWAEVVATGTGVDRSGIEDAFVMIDRGQYLDAQRYGVVEPSQWGGESVLSFDDLMGSGFRAGMADQMVLELRRPMVDMAATPVGGMPAVGLAPSTRYELKSAPVDAIKRVWAWDDNLRQFVMTAEPRRYGLGPEDFYATGTAAAELKSRSNHLWTVDPAAKATHAGFRDQTQQPLDNQWAQPWQGVVEDGASGATPVYRHVSYVRLRDGTVLKAPFLDYPLNPGDVYLGNRTLLGRKYDSVFQGVRSWKMSEHHLAMMARSFGGRYGYTPAQVELFKGRVDAYARETAYTGIGKHLGEIRITPYANARLRDDEVNRIGRGIFGADPVKNLVTGEMETPDFARLFADAHMQAWTLNFSSGLISRVKNFDLLSIGPLATWIADWVVPVIRFKASSVFRVSELLESKVFNALRGVNVSREERAVYEAAGLHPNANLLSADFGTDPLLESMFTGSQSRAAAEALRGVNGLDDLVAGEGTTGVAASYALWRDVNDLFSRKGARGLLEDIKDPARYKNGLMFDEQIEIIKRELPRIVKTRDPAAYHILSDVLKVPDEQMARFIVEDRILYGRWQRGGSFEDLLNHADQYTQTADMVSAESMAAIYATEDWQAVETLMRVAALSAQAEAFGTHFFGSYRSAMERSLNHPMLGIYPASWAYKAAKEWGRFLYDNRMFGQGQIRLGMFPAVAMNELVTKINIAVAQNSNDNWQDWLQNGPARNWLFLWNLLLPGDWSSLPLPLARPIRSISRAILAGDWEGLSPFTLASDTLFGPQGRGGIGVVRDFNLASRGLADLYNEFLVDEPGQWDNLAKGLSLNGVEQTPPKWDDLVSYPDPFSLTR